MNKYSGIRHIQRNTYEINFRPFKGAKRVQYRIEAVSKKEASVKRAEAIVEARQTKAGSIREVNGFNDLWPILERDLVAENKPSKTLHKFRMVFNRVFFEFREKKFPHIKSLTELSAPFFAEYRNYYSIDLCRPTGLKAEFIVVKAILGRLMRLGYCDESVRNSTRGIKIPKHQKKDYPEISDTKIKMLLDHIKAERPDLFRPIYLMSRTGRRVEETTLIERKDVQWAGINPIRLNIRAETTKMDERAPLDLVDSDLQTFVRQAYQDGKNQAALFMNRSGRKCDQGVIYKYLIRVSLEVIGVRITPHYFRHRFFTECGKKNLPMADVMAISGIRNVNVLMKYYSHSTREGLAKVLESTRIG